MARLKREYDASGTAPLSSDRPKRKNYPWRRQPFPESGRDEPYQPDGAAVDHPTLRPFRVHRAQNVCAALWARQAGGGRERPGGHKRRRRAFFRAFAEDATVQQGDPPTSSPYVKVPMDTRSTISVDFACDGSVFASTHGGGHTVKITDAGTNAIVRTLFGHPRTPWTVKFHPNDPHILASGCLGFQVRVWDLRRRAKAKVAAHHAADRSAAGGSGFAAMDEGDGRDPSMDPCCVHMISLQKEIISVAFHPTVPQLLAIAAGRDMFLWPYGAAPGSAVRVIRRGHTLRCVAWTPCGRYLMTGETNDRRSRQKAEIRHVERSLSCSSFHIHALRCDRVRSLNRSLYRMLFFSPSRRAFAFSMHAGPTSPSRSSCGRSTSSASPRK